MRVRFTSINTIVLQIFIILSILLAGCTPQLANNAEITPVTSIPTETDAVLCATGQDNSLDLSIRLDALVTVHEHSGNCEIDIDHLLSELYQELGNSLIAGGDNDSALDAFNLALLHNPDNLQVQELLQAIQTVSYNTVSETVCEQDGELADYQATEREFATLRDSGLEINEMPYPIYGVNYHPLNTPFSLFLTETNLDDIDPEFDLIREAGLNTLRIFLRPMDLFACDDDVPIVENFERLDSMIHLATDYDFRLIMVLNQDVAPDVLYFEDFVAEQTRFIVQRYQDEGAILAWDVRDSGDVDFREGYVRQDVATTWLAETIIMIREIDNQHLITVGYVQESMITAPLVDFVSFQFYGDYAALRQEIANLRASANRPILLASIGYSTFDISDINQRNFLFQAFEEVEQNGLMGWMVNHAFDYPLTVTCTLPDCPGEAAAINQYGLWNTGYFPKLAIEAVRLATGVDE